MNELNTIGLPESAVGKLLAIGVKSTRDFLLYAYLPDQHELVANNLEISPEKLKGVLEELCSEMDASKLERLTALARQANKIPSGVPIEAPLEPPEN